MRRLRNILLILLVIVIVFAGVGVGYAAVTVRRPLPQIDGTLTLSGLDGKVQIYRDASGVPQIYATTVHDLFFAQGVVQAQDRWWQMEFNRHTGLGRISELTGMNDSALSSDKFIRTLGWNRAAQADVDALSSETRQVLDAYSGGVNAYIDGKSGAELAVEYSVLALKGVTIPIEKWQPLDSVAWAKVLAWSLSGNMDAELERADLYKKVGKDLIDTYYAPAYPFGTHPTILTDADLPTLPVVEPIRAGSADMPDLSHVQTRLVGNVASDFGPIFGKGLGIGSNNWVISGQRTQSGKPILANDPHLGIQMPSIWYEIGLHCIQVSSACPYDVEGFSFPGAPGIVIGHNQRIAWGVTNVGPDTQDLYTIKTDPQDANKYTLDGSTQSMQIIPETIRFGDGTAPVTINVRMTHFGPIVTDNSDSADPKAAPMALHWPPLLVPMDVLGALLGVDRATNWASFRQALSGFASPSQNFIYADLDGNIGYQMPGLIPIRANGHSGLTPIDGSTTRYDWKGYIPFDDLPSTFNPARGYIASANNAVVPLDYYTHLAAVLGDQYGKDSNYVISQEWDYGYRAQRIEQLIKATDKHTVASIEAIQGDDYNGSAADLLPAVLKLNYGNTVPKDVLDWMAQWDYQNTMTSGQAALFEAFWVQITTKLWADQIGYTPDGTNIMWGTRQLLNQPTNAQWSDTKAPTPQTRDDILRSAFVAAYNDLSKQLGADYKSWQWGTLHTATFVSAPLGASGIAPLENLVNAGPVAVSGGPGIINATGWSTSDPYATDAIPSMRMIVDFSNFDNSRWIQSTGQSGHPASPHYRDMIERWRTIQYDTMTWDRATIQNTAASTLTLVPR